MASSDVLCIGSGECHAIQRDSVVYNCCDILFLQRQNFAMDCLLGIVPY